MSAVAEVTKSKVKEHILVLEKAVSEALTIDSKTGTATVAEGTYVKLLPAGISEEQATQLQTFHTDLAAATALAVGNMAIPLMKKHASLERVSLNMSTVGKDHLDVDFIRSREVPARDADNQPNGTKTQFGSTSVAWCMHGIGARGQLKAVKEQLKEMASAALSGK